MDSRSRRQKAEALLCKAVVLSVGVGGIMFVLNFLRVVYGP